MRLGGLTVLVAEKEKKQRKAAETLIVMLSLRFGPKDLLILCIDDDQGAV